jgi:hypothetical protein
LHGGNELIVPNVVAIQNQHCMTEGSHLVGAGAEEAMFLRVLLVLALRRRRVHRGHPAVCSWLYYFCG